MVKRLFFWGITAGILSAVASIIYNKIFTFAFTYKGIPDFSRIINIPVLIGTNLIAGLLAAGGFWAALRLFKKNGELIFNILFSILSFASILSPISAKLPLDLKNIELFPLLAIPMHFFPVIAWFTIRPFFAGNLYSR